MSDDTSIPAAPRLWTEAGFREDEWAHADSAEALSGNSRVILPLEAFLGIEPETRLALAERIGVHLLPGEPLEPILPHLSSVPLVSLAFPAFNDGRSYSKAALLRGRHGYDGVVRASGDVLIDQIPLMLRTGFNEFEVSNEVALRRLENGAPRGIANRYQPAVADEGKGPRFSWRRSGAPAAD